MTNLKKTLLFIALLSVPLFLQAQDAIITDRPSQSDGHYIIPKSVFQIESGLNFSSSASVGIAANTEQSLAFGTLFRLGLIQGLELRLITVPAILQVKTPTSFLESRTGIEDLQVGVKLRILDTKNDRPTSISLLAHAITPTGTEGFSSNNPGFVSTVIINQQLGTAHSLLANLGYEYSGLGDGDLLFSLMWGISLSDRLGVFLEPFTRGVELIEFQLSTDAGFTYRLNNNLQLDYTFGVGLNHDMNFHMAGIGIRFPHESN